MIRVHDAYGRELFITKQAWRDSVLLEHIKKVWNDPEELYSAIVGALRDGFGADMLKAAEQLASIDPDAERGAVVLAIVYREHKRPDDAEAVLRRHIARHGESGVVLTNLAKVYGDRSDQARVLETLWCGLLLDPNQGMGWYEVIHREKDGPAAGLDALRRIAAIPGAWRARLWLARDALVQRDLSLISVDTLQAHPSVDWVAYARIAEITSFETADGKFRCRVKLKSVVAKDRVEFEFTDETAHAKFVLPDGNSAGTATRSSIAEVLTSAAETSAVGALISK